MGGRGGRRCRRANVLCDVRHALIGRGDREDHTEREREQHRHRYGCGHAHAAAATRAAPVEPVTPIEAVTPVAPIEPVAPVAPVALLAPVIPNAPIILVAPVTLVAPVIPVARAAAPAIVKHRATSRIEPSAARLTRYPTVIGEIGKNPAYGVSHNVAMPWPTPMHMVAAPRDAPRRRIS
jgi:hypothetical protein